MSAMTTAPADPKTAKPMPVATSRSGLTAIKQLKADPLSFYMGNRADYGDYVRIKSLPGFDFYTLTYPTAIEHVLQTHQKNFRKPDVFLKPTILLFGNGIFTSEGDFWMKQRRLSQPAFHRNHIGAMAKVIVECVEKTLASWDAKPDGSQIDLQHEMVHLTLSVAGRTLFSTDLTNHATDVGLAVRDAFEVLNHKMNNYPFVFPLWVPTQDNKQFNRAKGILDSVITKIISERRKDSQVHHDFLGMLMSAKDEESGQGMSDEQLKDEVLTLLVAGHDTVAASLAWTWIMLSKHPHVRAQLHDELKNVLNGRTPDLADSERLTYTKMIFDETLRLYPPAWGQPRQSIDEDVIDGYYLPKNAFVSLNQYTTHRHPEFWEKPEEFDPERFTPDKVKGRPRFSYFPFGGGARVCIGQNLALLEAQLAIATIAQRYQIDILPGQTIVPDPTFTLIPRGIISATLKRR
jgi:cytochrome P450